MTHAFYDLSGQSGYDGVFGEAAAGSDGGSASAGEIVAIGVYGPEEADQAEAGGDLGN